MRSSTPWCRRAARPISNPPCAPWTAFCSAATTSCRSITSPTSGWRAGSHIEHPDKTPIYGYQLPTWWRARLTSQGRRTMPNAISVDVVSDVVCPWCFIGQKRLDSAIASLPEIEVEIRWRPFQLDRDHSGRGHGPHGIHGAQIRQRGTPARDERAHRAARRGRGHKFRLRRHQGVAQHARCTPTDPLGGNRRQRHAEHSGAQSLPALFRKGRQYRRPWRAACRRDRAPAWMRRSSKRCWPATPTAMRYRKKQRPPRRWALPACRASCWKANTR